MTDPYRRPPFWTPTIVELMRRRDRESDAVVADWLEERGYAVAAKAFRRNDQGMWRMVLLAVAESVPEAAPSEEILRMIEQRVQEIILTQQQVAARVQQCAHDRLTEAFGAALRDLDPARARGSALDRFAALVGVRRGRRR